MPSWLAAFAITAVGVMAAVPTLADRAFRSGWFERSTQTARARGDRRPTHGGAIAAVAVAIAVATTGLDGEPLRATLAVGAIAVLAGHRAEQDHGPMWAVPAGWFATAAAVPLLGVRAELTGTTWIDVALTALGVLALTAGIDAVDHTDGTAPAVAGAVAAGLLAVAIHAGDAVAPLTGALVGACIGLAAHAWPPGAVRIGAIGPMLLGPLLGIAGVAMVPEVSAPRSALVPVLILGPLVLLAPLPRLDRRLRRRGLKPNVLVTAAAGASAAAGATLARGDLGIAPAVLLAVVPIAVVVALGRTGGYGAVTDAPDPTTRARRRRLLLVAGGAAVVVGGVAAVDTIVLLSARDSMDTGRIAALAGLDAAREGDLEGAQRQFEKAADAFDDADGSLTNPLVRIGDVVPVLAPNLRAARALADVGGELTSTAVALAERAGADDLRVVDGRFPIEEARAIGVELGAARETLRGAVASLEEVNSAFLLGPLQDGREEVRDELADADASLEVVAEATRLVPGLLGADGDRRWMVAVMSTSEQRGAGGLLGDFAELRTADGSLELVRTLAARDLNAASEPEVQLAALPPVYATTYAGYDPGRFWQNLSVTPDVVTMSQAIAAAYPLTEGGGPVDGVIAIDPLGVAGLLELTGPVRVPGWPVPLTADNVAQVLLFDHYQQLDGEARERFQGLVVGEVVRALRTGSLPAPSRVAAALAPAVAGGHLRLWSADPEAQELFRHIGADGRVELSDGGDFVQLLTQNRSEAKIDWFLRRSLRYEVTVDPESGALTATATVQLTNEAPATGVADYIIGERGGPTRPGVNRMAATIITPHLPTGATDAAGNRVPMSLAQENGLNLVSVEVELEPGASTTIELSFEGAVPPGSAYRLTVGRQPAGRPDLVDVDVRPVDGWTVQAPPGGSSRFDQDRRETVVARFRRA